MLDISNNFKKQLFEKNTFFEENFRNNKIMHFVISDNMENKQTRDNFLSAIQLFSNYFQKMIMIRYVTTSDNRFLNIVEAHMKEEFGHNQILMNDRQNKPAVWDTILEAVSSWFCWKMLVVDNVDKTLLMHMVLEKSAEIFFKSADEIMKKFGETDYFGIHNEVDGDHASMGNNVFNTIGENEYQRLSELQAQAWEMMKLACDRIAEISENSIN